MDRKEYMKEYRLKNKEKIKQKQAEYFKKYATENKEKIKNYQAEYKKNVITPKRKNDLDYREKYLEQKKIYDKDYYETNKEIIRIKKRKYEAKKRNTNILYKLKNRLRSMIGNAIRRKGYLKNNQSEVILGCSFEEFRGYIESKWESWMNWENYGKYDGNYNTGWDIDHIISVSNAKNEKDLYSLNHYTNLQPLCSKVNRDEKRNL